MKKIILAITLLLLVSCTSSNPVKTELNEDELKKQLRSYVHKLGLENDELKLMLLKQEIQAAFMKGQLGLSQDQKNFWYDSKKTPKLKIYPEKSKKEN